MISWILGRVSAKFLLVSLLVLLGTNALSAYGLRYYQKKATAEAFICAAEVERSAREAQEAVSDALRAAYEADLAAQVAEGQKREKALQEAHRLQKKVLAEKAQLQRRLNDALQDKDVRSWADTPVPPGLLNATGDNET